MSWDCWVNGQWEWVSWNPLRDLPTTVTKVNLMNNRLSRLSRDEKKEIPCFPSSSHLTHLGLRSNCLIKLPQQPAWWNEMTNLTTLFLTDNRLKSLPPSIGSLRSLRKLQLSHNCLSSLPIELAQCSELELLRLSHNADLTDSPTLRQVLSALPALKWITLSGTAACPWSKESCLPQLPVFPFIASRGTRDLDERKVGASGQVTRVRVTHPDGVEKELALKIFRQDQKSPDGSIEDEVNALALLFEKFESQKNEGVVVRPRGRVMMTEGVLMDWIPDDHVPLGSRPGFEGSCELRSTQMGPFFWDSSTRQKIASQLHQALRILWGAGVLMGDLFPHNVLVNPSLGHAVLCDLGASTCVLHTSEALRSILLQCDVRAWRCLCEEELGLEEDHQNKEDGWGTCDLSCRVHLDAEFDPSLRSVTASDLKHAFLQDVQFYGFLFNGINFLRDDLQKKNLRIVSHNLHYFRPYSDSCVHADMWTTDQMWNLHQSLRGDIYCFQEWYDDQQGQIMMQKFRQAGFHLHHCVATDRWEGINLMNVIWTRNPPTPTQSPHQQSFGLPVETEDRCYASVPVKYHQDDDDAEHFVLVVTHLDVHGQDDSVRQQQLTRVLDDLDGKSALVVGDLNTLDRRMYSKDQWDWLERQTNSRPPKIPGGPSPSLSTRVIPLALQRGWKNGWVDLPPRSRNHSLTPAFTAWSARVVDHFLFSPKFPLSRVRCLRPHFDAISDHLPLILDLQ